MTDTQRQKRIRILRLAGASPTHRPQRSIDRELSVLLGKDNRKAPAFRSGPDDIHSHLDARGVRRYQDARGREVRTADLPAVIRYADAGISVRYAAARR